MNNTVSATLILYFFEAHNNYKSISSKYTGSIIKVITLINLHLINVINFQKSAKVPKTVIYFNKIMFI